MSSKLTDMFSSNLQIETNVNWGTLRAANSQIDRLDWPVILCLTQHANLVCRVKCELVFRQPTASGKLAGRHCCEPQRPAVPIEKNSSYEFDESTIVSPTERAGRNGLERRAVPQFFSR